MKNSISQYIKAYIHDNKNFIDGNIAEHLLYNFYNNDNVFYEYLTDEEIEEINNNVELTHKKGEEIVTFIKNNFNYDIAEFEY